VLTDYIKIGSNEIANTARLSAYIAALGSPFSTASLCACPTLTAEVIGDLPYTIPANEDPDLAAPWYDVDVPDSADFLGFLPLSVAGTDDYPVTRAVTSSVSGTGSIGSPRITPRTITVTGLLIGRSCCAVEYGLHWLAEALQGCNGGSCSGDCMSMYLCCPPEEITAEQYNARYRRTYRRVALTSGPTVVQRDGDGQCNGTCGNGADIVTVEFVLTAGTPWAWTDSTELLDVELPVDTSEDCVTWCKSPSEDPLCEVPCPYATCHDAADLCADPLHAPAALPSTGSAPLTGACLPLATTRQCYELDLTDRPQWSVDALNVEIQSGTGPLRNVIVKLYSRGSFDDATPCDTIANSNRCNAYATWHISYIPAGGGITLDGQVGRAILECAGNCGPARNVYGEDGAPPAFPPLDCSSYCLCIETDVLNPPAEGSGLIVSIAGKGL
jgi:hypothetical protein